MADKTVAHTAFGEFYAFCLWFQPIGVTVLAAGLIGAVAKGAFAVFGF